MATISINATTDATVSYRTVISNSVSNVQVVEMLVDLSARTGYVSTDGVSFTSAQIIAGILASRRNAKTVRVNYLATYDLMQFIPSKSAVGLTDSLEYILRPGTYGGTTLQCFITKLAVTESLLAPAQVRFRTSTGILGC